MTKSVWRTSRDSRHTCGQGRSHSVFTVNADSGLLGDFAAALSPEKAWLLKSDGSCNSAIQAPTFHCSFCILTHLSSSLQPQILQPFNRHLSEHLQQERALRAPPTEGRSDLRKGRPDTGSHTGADTPVGDPVDDPDKPSGLISPRLRSPGASQEEEARDSPVLHKSVAPRAAASTCPRLLQPLRLQKRVSLPALKPAATAAASPLKSGSSLVPLANQLKQLPPPSRGLPSFHAEPSRSLCGPWQLQPRRTSRPPRDARGSGSSLD